MGRVTEKSAADAANEEYLRDIYKNAWPIFLPGDYDGKFWTLWCWIFIPLVISHQVYLGTHVHVKWWLVLLVNYTMTTGVTLGFHRYFAHASFRCTRDTQLFLALLGCFSGQTGPISWGLIHKDHHQGCETASDPHSIREGFWHAHGFFLWSGCFARRSNLLPSPWSRYPEIVFIERWAPAIYYSYGIAILALSGWQWTVVAWYWLLPTFLSWNGVQLINSAAHTWGEFKYYDFYQPDQCNARNLWWAFPLLPGDNWHNQHHAYPKAAWHGWEWWQIDPNGYLIALMCALGFAWNPVSPPKALLDKRRVRKKGQEGELRRFGSK